MQQAAQSLGEAILAALSDAPPPPSPDEPPNLSPPTNAQEFVASLESLYDMGWAFDSSYPARLTRIDDQPPTPPELNKLAETRAACPSLPHEIAELAWYALTGNQPDEQIVGDTDTVEAKINAVRHLVINDDYRERFYLQTCSKLPRYRGIDWEVVIKAAERGHSATPWYPYALVTVDTVEDARGHHEHKTLAFSVGINGLNTLIDELVALKGHLERVHLAPRSPSASKEHEDA